MRYQRASPWLGKRIAGVPVLVRSPQHPRAPGL